MNTGKALLLGCDIELDSACSLRFFFFEELWGVIFINTINVNSFSFLFLPKDF